MVQCRLREMRHRGGAVHVRWRHGDHRPEKTLDNGRAGHVGDNVQQGRLGRSNRRDTPCGEGTALPVQRGGSAAAAAAAAARCGPRHPVRRGHLPPRGQSSQRGVHNVVRRGLAPTRPRQGRLRRKVPPGLAPVACSRAGSPGARVHAHALRRGHLPPRGQPSQRGVHRGVRRGLAPARTRRGRLRQKVPPGLAPVTCSRTGSPGARVHAHAMRRGHVPPRGQRSHRGAVPRLHRG